MCWKIMEILGNSGRRMGNVLENHGNPRKFWEKDGKCAGKNHGNPLENYGNPSKFLGEGAGMEILANSGRRMGNVLENYEKS